MVKPLEKYIMLKGPSKLSVCCHFQGLLNKIEISLKLLSPTSWVSHPSPVWWELGGGGVQNWTTVDYVIWSHSLNFWPNSKLPRAFNNAVLNRGQTGVTPLYIFKNLMKTYFFPIPILKCTNMRGKMSPFIPCPHSDQSPIHIPFSVILLHPR